MRVASMILTHTSVDRVVEALQATSWPSEAAQVELVARVASYIDAYPLSPKYQKYLAKMLSRQVADEHLTDEFAEFACVLSHQVPNEGDEDDKCYFSYLIPRDGNILGKVESDHEDFIAVPLRCLRGHNFVGFRVWTAGMALTELLLARQGKELVEGKHVIELGAGVGVTGVVAAASVRMKSLLMTDFAEEIVENLRHSVDINKKHHKCEVIRVEQLDWRAASSREDVEYLYGSGSGGWPDVILAADCTYSEDIQSPLVMCIESLLLAAREASNSCPECSREAAESEEAIALQLRHGPVAIVAGEVRSESTYAHFLQVLESRPGIAFQDVTQWALAATEDGRLFHYERRDQLRFVVLWLDIEP